MNISRSAVRSSRWSKPIEQFLRGSTQTSPRRGFASATRVTAIQNSQQPHQQRLARQAGGYGRIEQRRPFSYSPISLHGHLDPPKPGEELHVTFVDKDGDEQTFVVAKGDNLLDIAQANDVEMEGACGGSCACSTCHVIVEDEGLYDKMEEPDDDENDMLDLAFGLTETSRLGCQVKMNKELDGLRVKLPSMTRNLQASDFSQKNERSDN
ncbi:hypothetical protein V491_02779 [Pseudogymnoascus sp. VKM F-3775]|nr:hypothetical protein V491_02779 [Pseudogymnoascus sp. VKM F-3775]